MVVGESKAVVLILENDDTSSDASTELGNEALRSPEHRPDGPDRLEELARRDCLIIFDWDDTLLTTTWLGEQGLLEEEEAVISPEIDAQLQALADRVVVTLEAAKRRGSVAIVTNAEHGWVEVSCRAFLPSLEAHLAGVKVVSARGCHEENGLFAPTRWKCLAFGELVGEFYSVPGDTDEPLRRRSVVSLGDSEHEMEALKWAATGVECHAKSLKFVQRPCLEDLVEEHELVAGLVDCVIDHAGNLDYEIGPEDR
jgi:phosphoglycolate phosphatase-like HAD superfamily hydrolase